MHAGDAISRFNPEQRHISTLLLNISEDAHRLISKKIEQFREEVFEIVKSDSSAQRIMQLSVQFFPKSQIKRSRA